MAEPISTSVVSSTPGRVRLRINPLKCHSSRMQSITDALEEHPQVNRVRANLQTGSILIITIARMGVWRVFLRRWQTSA